ncbi:NmrA-like family protein [Colletotrichum graminicola]|uniref:NmrA-like family protein n=1 Tax=Colletotrichum graminicola (strain M1.001 / M2 / FGSC 10212) TaxID=645133 RepID=E3QSS8_COLGM|nr:NmrA-like family protein [Colletotrichum graminicola M1.001]EFQ33916.1 NmrA-like family protein [Colletotrichum graminicola M1.001]WDK21107.1 NmrA-like family protein [Colletotrichum graminicola]
MVRIALAGGAGNVGKEVHDALVARGKHEILILSRKDAPAEALSPGVQWIKTSYDDVDQLAEALEGVHTVLSFMTGPMDPTNAAQEDGQKPLIDASIKAGVKRFAPSEWATSKFNHMFWYNFKDKIRKYLMKVNKEKKVIEYTLFQPGFFTNYLTFPFSSAKHVNLFETPVNYHQHRVLTTEGGEDAIVTMTTAQDFAKVVALAVEYEGEWPLVSGIKGGTMTIGQIIALGEKLRGKPFEVTKLNPKDLKAGVVKAPWLPRLVHPAIPQETLDAVIPSFLVGFLLGISAGNFEVSDEWNRLLPDFEFTQPEEFLATAWAAIDAGAKSVHTD